MTTRSLAPLCVLALAVTACGSTAAVSSNDGGPSADATSADAASSDAGSQDAASPDGATPTDAAGSTCPVGDPPGKSFTLHVKNDGTRALALAYGCGSLPPITLVTPTGTFATDPYAINFCGVDCKRAYAGQGTGACSDCGPGYGAALGAGATVDLAWTHLVYVAQGIDPSCLTPPQTGQTCALEQAAPVSPAQQGTLTICAQPSGTGGGYCSKSETVPFTIDTTGSEATIHVQ
jgi:hypothetical protein